MNFKNSEILADNLLNGYYDLLLNNIFSGELNYLIITIDSAGAILLYKSKCVRVWNKLFFFTSLKFFLLLYIYLENGKLDAEIVNAPKLESNEKIISVSGAGDW